MKHPTCDMCASCCLNIILVHQCRIRLPSAALEGPSNSASLSTDLVGVLGSRPHSNSASGKQTGPSDLGVFRGTRARYDPFGQKALPVQSHERLAQQWPRPNKGKPNPQEHEPNHRISRLQTSSDHIQSLELSGVPPVVDLLPAFTRAPFTL